MILNDFLTPADNRTNFNVYATNPFATQTNRKTVLVKNKKRWEIKGDILEYVVSSYQPYDFSMDVWVYNLNDYEKFKNEWEHGVR